MYCVYILVSQSTGRRYIGRTEGIERRLAALSLTVPGVVAHQSALNGGELLKVPQYE